MSFRARIRRWLFADAPAATVAEDAVPPMLGQVSRAVLAQLPGLRASPQSIASFQGMPVVVRPIKAPLLLPGVLPDKPAEAGGEGMLPFMAMDSAELAPAWAWANQANCGLGFPGYAYLSELAQRTEYRSPVETIAAEMTREWITLKTTGKGGAKAAEQEDDAGTPGESEGGEEGERTGVTGAEDKIEDLVNALEAFKIRDLFRRMAEYDGFFGRGQIYIDVIPPTSANADELKKLPLLIDKRTIKKGSVQNFAAIEPLWTTPYAYNANDPTRPWFYKPQAWFVMGRMIHSTRLLTFTSREVPDMLKPAYNFGGLSLTQLMEPYVFQWLRTRNSVSDLIHNFSILVLKTNLTALLQGPNQDATTAAKAATDLLSRAKMFTQTRDNQGLMLIDKTDEEMEQIAVPLGTLDALQAQAQEHMAGPSHIPLVKLFGITPTGLNASSEGEIKVFYDFIRSMQQLLFAPALTEILNILQLHLFGEIDDTITFEFVPLTSPSVKELADIRKQDVDGGVALVQAGAITTDELRERLMSDPNSGYMNLTGEAPEPPDVSGLDAEGNPIEGTDNNEEGGDDEND